MARDMSLFCPVLSWCDKIPSVINGFNILILIIHLFILIALSFFDTYYITSDLTNYFSVLPNFAQRVDVAVEVLSSTPGKEVDENEFIDASHLVYDGVREIRMAVLMNKADDELDPDDVLMDEYHTLEIRSKCEYYVF